jgi:hypothetical protein
MILVFRNDVHVSTINFGWEPDAFYQKWMGNSKDDEVAAAMSGATIDITSPDRVPPQGMLAFFMALLDDNWRAKIRAHYAAVKQTLAKPKPSATRRYRPGRGSGRAG